MKPETLLHPDLEKRLQAAVAAFWTGRNGQARRQLEAGRVRDVGTRGSVTEGGYMDAFVDLTVDTLLRVGMPLGLIWWKRELIVPGIYRATKEWDLPIVHGGDLVIAVGFKSQVPGHTAGYLAAL